MVGRPPTRRQQLQLAAWWISGKADLTFVDLLRLIVYAGGARDPWAYVSAGMERLAGEPERWESLERRASNKQRQYAQYADNPRAYLATCIKNDHGRRPPESTWRRVSPTTGWSPTADDTTASTPGR